jgi:hypothetical protein
VADDALTGSDDSESSGDDAVELSIYTAGVIHQLLVGADGRQSDRGIPITSLTVATATIPGGWSLEVRVPPSALGLAEFKVGQTYPFTFGLWDDDIGAATAQTHLIWNGASTDSGVADWGKLELAGATHIFRPPTETPSPTATPSPTQTPTATPGPTQPPGIYLPITLR